MRNRSPHEQERSAILFAFLLLLTMLLIVLARMAGGQDFKAPCLPQEVLDAQRNALAETRPLSHQRKWLKKSTRWLEAYPLLCPDPDLSSSAGGK